MFNLFKKKPYLEPYEYKIDLKLDATPQEIFEISCLPQVYYRCIGYDIDDQYYCLLSEVYDNLPENLKRHFTKLIKE